MPIPQERFEIEMAELDAEEAKLVEAEEEELWLLTLQQQSKHIQQHIEFDLPQAAYAHMDPILYKKLDWELTNGQDLMHHEVFQAADCEQVSRWELRGELQYPLSVIVDALEIDL